MFHFTIITLVPHFLPRISFTVTNQIANYIDFFYVKTFFQVQCLFSLRSCHQLIIIIYFIKYKNYDFTIYKKSTRV